MEYENEDKKEEKGSQERAEELSEIYERQSRRYSKNLDVREEVK